MAKPGEKGYIAPRKRKAPASPIPQTSANAEETGLDGASAPRRKATRGIAAGDPNDPRRVLSPITLEAMKNKRAGVGIRQPVQKPRSDGRPNNPDVSTKGNTRCTAHRTNGDPCNNYAVHGTSVCRKHGGAVEVVKNAARVRLAMGSNKAAKMIRDFVDDDSIPANVRLNAAKDLLDRAGVQGKAEVSIEVSTFQKIVQDGSVLVDLDGDDED